MAIGGTGRWDVRALVVATALIVLGGCTVVDAGRTVVGRGALTPPPATLPETVGAELLGGQNYRIDDPEANWGMGYAAANGVALSQVQLPLFSHPRGSAHWGWLTNGRGYDQRARTATPARFESWIQLANGARALAVMRQRRNGWIQVRWGEPSDPMGGLAWTTRSYAGAAGLQVNTWGQTFVGSAGLVFRDTDTTYNLRNGPGVDSLVIGRVAGVGYDLEALDISGDWMRVTLHRPPLCEPPADGAGDTVLLGGPADGLLGSGPQPAATPRSPTTQSGWLKWRSDDKGPWIAQANICADPSRPIG